MITDSARRYWNAAFYYRRASPHRDRSIAIRALQQSASKDIGPVKSRAFTMLQEITDHGNERSSHTAE